MESKEQKVQESSYKRIFSSTGLMGAVQLLTMLAAILRSKAAATFIRSAGMAVNDLFSRNIALIGSISNLGLGFSAVQRIAKLHENGDAAQLIDEARNVRTWVAVTALGGLLLGLLGSPALSYIMAGDLSVTLHFCLLAPVVAFTTLTGGEIAILKGLHQLKRLAFTTAASAVATLAIAVPIYWWLGFSGIIPVLFFSTLATLLLHLLATHRPMPYRLRRINRAFVRDGKPLVYLGLSYVMAGVVATATELVLRTVLKFQMQSWEELGFYAAGFTLIVSYAQLVFVAMDADFFPRLSAAVRDLDRMQRLVSRQTNVLVMLMTPLLILFALLLPVIIPILLTEEFLPVIPMVVCGLSFMFFKAVYSPAAYLSLANADSKLYFVMETAYNVVLIICVLCGYTLGGLAGAGLGLSAANFYDLVAITVVYRRRYALRYEVATPAFCLAQFLCLAAALVACYVAQPLTWRIAVCAVSILFSVSISLFLLRRRSQSH